MPATHLKTAGTGPCLLLCVIPFASKKSKVERQSFSNLQKLYKFWNSVLYVKLQICTVDDEIFNVSLKDSENLEKSLCVRDKAESQ